MQTLTHLTLKSSNAKTGPIPVSTTGGQTCPGACPFNNSNAGGCYAASGPIAIHWGAVTKGARGMPWAEFCAAIAALPDGQLWRHNQAGDLPGDGDKLDDKALYQLIMANRGRRGFTYTHKPMTSARARLAIQSANANGFTINLSANNPAHADTLAALNIGPVVTVLPAGQTQNTATPAGRKIVVCPAITHDNVSCADCQLCARADRTTIIGFPAHGTGKKKAEHAIKFFRG